VLHHYWSMMARIVCRGLCSSYLPMVARLWRFCHGCCCRHRRRRSRWKPCIDHVVISTIVATTNYSVTADTTITTNTARGTCTTIFCCRRWHYLCAISNTLLGHLLAPSPKTAPLLQRPHRWVITLLYGRATHLLLLVRCSSNSQSSVAMACRNGADMVIF
jgi:hypothetical protein